MVADIRRPIYLTADFLKAAPIPGYDQRVKGSRVFQTMVKRYLGVPLLPAGEQPSFCRGCRKDVMDCFGDHALVCRQGSDKITRHNRLTEVLIVRREGWHAASAGATALIA